MVTAGAFAVHSWFVIELIFMASGKRKQPSEVLTAGRVAPALLVFVLASAASAPGQILVEGIGNALDAPGAGNSSFSAGAGSSRALLTMFRPGSPDTNLPSLAAAIDPGVVTFIPSLNPIGHDSTAVGDAGRVISPYGFNRGSSSSAFSPPSLDASPLSAARPTLVQPTTAPSTLFGNSGGSPFNLSLNFPNTLNQTPLPTFSASSVPSASGLSAPRSLTAPSRSTPLPIVGAYYEEEILGGRFTLGEGLTPVINPVFADGGFGMITRRTAEIPWPKSDSTKTTFPGGATISIRSLPGLRAKTARDLQPYITRTPRAPRLAPTTPTWPTDALLNAADDQSWRFPAIGNPFMEQALRHAKSAVTPQPDQAVPTTPQSPGGFNTTPQTATQVQGPGLFDGQRIYTQLKKTVQTLNRMELARQRSDLAAGDFGPSLSQSYAEVRDYVRNNAENPLSSLVGGAAGQFARQAEQELKNGSYYKALAHYDVAMVVDRNNPLLVLGQAHALIATGEYTGAIRKLLIAIERFPEIAYFKLDLNEFITDADLIDIRRADLEKRLALGADYRYRFLLGYIEYNTGLVEFGLQNMETAAATAPASSPIAGFLKTVRTGNWMRDKMKKEEPTP